MKTGDRIKVHFYDRNYSDHREIKTDITDKIFTVYEKNGKLGFDGNMKKSPYTCKGEVFTPFEVYAQTVVFENVETGEKYRFDNMKNKITQII